MEQISAEERELRSALAGYIENADKVCGMQLLDETEALARKLMNLGLARDIAELVMDLVRCRKLSENFKEEDLGELAYRFSGSVSYEELKYSMDRPPQHK
jgi:hypothetical protein